MTKDGAPAVGETVSFNALSLNNVGPISGLESEDTNEEGLVTKTLTPTLTDKYVTGSFVIQTTARGKTANTTVEITPEKLVDKLDLTLSATDVKTDELVTGEVKLSNQKGPVAGADVNLSVIRASSRTENMEVIKVDPVTDSEGILRFEVDPDIPYTEPSETPITYEVKAEYGSATPKTETVTVTRPLRPKKGVIETDVSEVEDGGEIPYKLTVTAEGEDGETHPAPLYPVRVRLLYYNNNISETNWHDVTTDKNGEVLGVIKANLIDPTTASEVHLRCYNGVPGYTDPKAILVKPKGS